MEVEMTKVAKAYEHFRHIQLSQHEDMAEFKEAKEELRTRLSAFTEQLNRQIYSTHLKGEEFKQEEYEAYLASHQPFHWFAEYYQIIHGNGGFDVIIGNPPYVVYTDSSSNYLIGDSFKTRKCANLYAFCIERCTYLISIQGRFGMIVPNSSISANKMSPLQEIIVRNKSTWISNYAWRPSKLFEGADMLLAIVMNVQSEIEQVVSTVYHKWYREFRDNLFQNISYTNVSQLKVQGSIPKVPTPFLFGVMDKMKKQSNGRVLTNEFSAKTDYYLYYFRAVQYWFKVLNSIPIFIEDGVQRVTGEMKPLYFSSRKKCDATISLLSSSLFFLNYIIWSSCQVVNSRDFDVYFSFISMNKDNLDKLVVLGEQLQEDYQKNSHIIKRSYSKKGRVFSMEKQHFYIKLSKPIIDEIDKVLAEHYGFTEEELDFIINYDIKYRMGDELEAD